MNVEVAIAHLRRLGWRVFIDSGLEVEDSYGVGLSRSGSLGVEGVAYCEHAFDGVTLIDALTAALDFAQAAQQAEVR